MRNFEDTTMRPVERAAPPGSAQRLHGYLNEFCLRYNERMTGRATLAALLLGGL